jgi:S-phase kinase-associated protein 1
MNLDDTCIATNAEIKQYTDVTGLDCDNNCEEVILVSKDEKEFTIKTEFLKHSKVLTASLEHKHNPEDKIYLKTVEGEIIECIIKYLEHHTENEIKSIPYPLPSKNLDEVVSKWDSDYIDEIAKSRKKLYKLITAANYLNIDGLLQLGAAKVAALVKGEPIEKLKDILVDK